MNEANSDNVWWKLKNAWTCIIKNLPLQFIPFVGIVFGGLVLADEIGILIKVNKLKRQMPDRVEFRDFFKCYIVSIFVPIVGQLFWAKALNHMMKFLETKDINQEDISYVGKIGKIYGIVGLVGELIGMLAAFAISLIFFYPALNRMNQSLFLVTFMRFLLYDLTIEIIKLTAIYLVLIIVLILPYWIISVILRIKILKRLISCIDYSGFGKDV